MKRLENIVLATVMACLLVPMASAVEWSRNWEQSGGNSGNVMQQAEFLLLKNLQLAPHNEVSKIKANLKFRSGGTLPRLLIGESERIFTFVFVATADHSGTTYCVTTRVMCIPRKGYQPFVWVPRGFKKKNSNDPEEDPRVALRRIGLLPDGDFDFWFHKIHQPVAWQTLKEEIQAGKVFPFQLDLEATRPSGYEIASTIDKDSMRIRVLADGTARVTFRDGAAAALVAAQNKERVMYQFTVEKRYGFDSAHYYRPIGESVVPAAAATAQTIDIAQNASFLTQSLELNKFYRISVKVARPSYGSTPSEALIKPFAYIRGEEY